MRAHDIGTLISVGRPRLAPDGSFAVFATSRPDLAANRNVGQLWRVDLPDGTPRRLTRGIADAAPVLSPDGSRVAFLRGDAKGRAQLFVVAAGGGEPVQATDQPLGVLEAVWAPDGATLAFTAMVPEAGRYGTVEGLDAPAEAPRRITGLRWHANALGYIVDRPAQVFIVAAPDLEREPSYEPAASVLVAGEVRASLALVQSTPTALTAGARSHSGLAFTADGGEVLAIVSEIEQVRPDLRSRVLALSPGDGSAREVLSRTAGLAVSGTAVASDGTIAVLASHVGERGTDFVAQSVALWMLTDMGPRPLTDPATVDLGDVGSHITPLGADWLVQDHARGRTRLLRVSRQGQATEVLGGDLEVTGHAAAEARIVVAVATPDSAGEVLLVHDDGARALTALGAGAQATGLVIPAEREIAGRDGYPVHGWVARPAGQGPFPVILQIHGGPYSSYGIHLFDETQVLVDAGYAVVYCNPRGSSGYGMAHGRSIRGAMGTVDFADVIDFLDGVIAADPALDAQRVGVQGGSYGGYLTAWIIAHDHRFAGAVVERGFLDPVSFQGTSDIGSFFGDEYVGSDADDIARQSPMAVVGQVRTPTLVVHSELDFRCPLEQATRYYSALRRCGVDAELLIFPGEDHELSRSGRPRHRLERFEAILDWWQRHLPVTR